VARQLYAAAAVASQGSAEDASSLLVSLTRLKRNPANHRAQQLQPQRQLQPQGATAAVGNTVIGASALGQADYSLEQALQWSTGCAIENMLDPQRCSVALELMWSVEHVVAAELAVENGNAHGMHWLVARPGRRAKSAASGLMLAGNAAQLILLATGPRGRPGARSSWIVALQLDSDGFPVRRASSPTAAVSALCWVGQSSLLELH
jgi:hypothetical protein